MRFGRWGRSTSGLSLETISSLSQALAILQKRLRHTYSVHARCGGRGGREEGLRQIKENEALRVSLRVTVPPTRDRGSGEAPAWVQEKRGKNGGDEKKERASPPVVVPRSALPNAASTSGRVPMCRFMYANPAQ